MPARRHSANIQSKKFQWDCAALVRLQAIGSGLWPAMVLLSEIVQTFILADFWCAALLRLRDLLCSLNEADIALELVRRALGATSAANCPVLRLGQSRRNQTGSSCLSVVKTRAQLALSMRTALTKLVWWCSWFYIKSYAEGTGETMWLLKPAVLLPHRTPEVLVRGPGRPS